MATSLSTILPESLQSSSPAHPSHLMDFCCFCILCWPGRGPVWPCNFVSETGGAAFLPLLLFGKIHSWGLSSHFRKAQGALGVLIIPYLHSYLPFTTCQLLSRLSPSNSTAVVRAIWIMMSGGNFWLHLVPKRIWSHVAAWEHPRDSTSYAEKRVEYICCVSAISNALWCGSSNDGGEEHIRLRCWLFQNCCLASFGYL